MSDTTKIQWCDSTVNPIMGCHGCELFPSSAKVLEAVAEAMRAAGADVDSESIKKIYEQLIDDIFNED